MTLLTFGEPEQRIPSEIVCRVHKSYMVAVEKIESIERDRIQIGRVTIPVSASYREKFYAIIGHRRGE
jgi:DNA-binding LytR/AlgR family response regulator